jgi:hypothetical protein
MTNTKKLLLAAGVVVATTAFIFRGVVPEVVRYVRIRRM